MSLLLNARANQFKFLFPKGFIYKELEDKYAEYLKDLPIPYPNVLSFINSTVQSISFPGIESIQGVNQVQAGRNIQYRSGFKSNQLIDKTLTVTFRNVDSWLNYWIMYDLLLTYNDFAAETNGVSDNEYLNSFSILYLNMNGNLTILQKLDQVLYTGITDLNLAYTDIGNSTKSFTCTFAYNYFTLQTYPMVHSAANVNIYT